MRWGLLLEKEIAAEYRRETGRKITNPGRYTIYQHEDFPWMQATLDREIVAFDDRGPGVLEVKTCNAYGVKDWEGGAPLYYRVQVQHQLAVTGYAWGSLAVLIGGNDFRWMDISRNDEFIEALVRVEERFWWRVKHEEPPEADGHDATSRILKELHPSDNGESVALPPEFIDLHAERTENKQTIKRLEERNAVIDNRLRAAIGDCSYGFLPGARYSLLTQERQPYLKVSMDSKPGLESAGIPFEETKGNKTRVLRVRELEGE